MRNIGTASARHADVKHTRANYKTTLSSDYIDSLMEGTGCLDFFGTKKQRKEMKGAIQDIGRIEKRI